MKLDVEEMCALWRARFGPGPYDCVQLLNTPVFYGGLYRALVDAGALTEYNVFEGEYDFDFTDQCKS